MIKILLLLWKQLLRFAQNIDSNLHQLLAICKSRAASWLVVEYHLLWTPDKPTTAAGAISPKAGIVTNYESSLSMIYVLVSGINGQTSQAN